MGHHITIVTNDTGNLGPYEFLDASGKIIGSNLDDSKNLQPENTCAGCIEVFRFPCVSLLGGRYPVPIKNSLFNTLVSKLDETDFSGVLVNTRFYLHSLIGTRFALRQGIRPIVLDHGSAYLTLGSTLLDYLIARYEDAITSVLKRRDVDFYGISQKSISWLAHFGIHARGVLANSIDAERYRAQASDRDFRRDLGLGPQDFLISFTGRFIPEKGVSVLLDAFELLNGLGEAGTSIHLAMAGEGPLASEIVKRGLESVHVLGRLDQSDIAALLICSDLFCLPTRSEGFSTSLLEAAACGTPCVVTDVGGARELIPDEAYGVILSNSDSCMTHSFEASVAPDDLAGALSRMVSRRNELPAMGRLCSNLVSNLYSWRSTAEKVLDAFDDASRSSACQQSRR